jgi:hypothetical protein
MSKFKGSSDEGYRFQDNGGYEIPLNQENLTGIFFRNEEWYDRICVLDDRDGMHFSYFRDEVDQEVFNQVCEIAWAIGTVVLRDTASQSIVEAWEEEHQVSNEEIDQFLGDVDGS